MELAPIPAEAATETRADAVLCGRALRDAVKLLTGKLVERRQNIAALAAILFDIAPDGTATLTATDLDTWASVTLTATGDSCDTLEPGRFAVNADALHKILSKAGKLERVRLRDTGEGRAILKASRSEWKVPTLPVDDFPLAPISTYRAECGGTVDRAQFLSDLAALSPAMQAEETRYYLHGVALQVREFGGRERFALVATDGYMMAAASRPIPAGCEAWGDAIMHRKAVAFTLAADKLAGAGDMTLSQSGEFMALEFGALRIVSKLVDGTYPDWPQAFVAIAAPTDGEQGALFPDLLPEWPLPRTEALQKAAAGAIEWRGGNGGVMGECVTDPDMMWCAQYIYQDGHARRAGGFTYDEGLTVEVAGDREYRIATKGAKIELTKEQVAALCGDDLWNVLEFPGADGRPRYVSQWLWDDGDSRLLLVGKDGRCPKAGAPREYVTRAEVEAALAGEVAAPAMIEAPAPIPAEPVAACQMLEDCAEPAPAPTETPEAPACDPTPVSCPAADDADPIAAVRAKLAELEAMIAALPAQSVPAKRTPAHERAIRRAWAERKAARLAMAGWNRASDDRRALRKERDDWEGLAMRTRNKRRRAVLKAREAKRCARYFIRQSGEHYDRAINAEHEAREALAAREDLKRMLEAAEARLSAAEAENAQLWAEIETLTAPVAALAD